MLQVMCIMLGGALGALSRYWVDSASYLFLDHHFPYGTWMVNILGSFLAGLIFTILLMRFDGAATHYRAFFMIGFLGSFTTFSTFMLETWQLLEHGALLRAASNMLANVLGGLVAVWLGLWLGKQLV